MKKSIILIALFLLSHFHSAKADEGMWVLPLLSQQNISQMKGLGLDICAEDIYHPDSVSLKDAVVIFGRGCTGEVISPNGLILTNHHCGYSYIQQHSSVNNDLLTNGFWAKNRNEELPNPGLTVTFIDKIEDVTDYVQNEIKKDTVGQELNYLSATYLNNLAEKKIGKDFLKKHPGITVTIKPFYGGNQYYMFTQKVYSDVRMVGAPPSSIGKFGADTDNWMWPRHTGDFSIFRVYADSTGNPAPYSEENIPLRPKKYFNLSTQGIQENDFVMLMGFPGRTNHYYTPAEVIERRDIENSIRVEVRDLRQQLMLEEMLSNPKIRIQYSGKYATSTNSYKSSKGMNKMIEQQQMIPLKESEQKNLLIWSEKHGKPEYRQAIEDITEIVNSRADLKKRQQYLNEALFIGIEFSRVPTNQEVIDKMKISKKKILSDSALKIVEKGYLKFYNKDYAPEVDKKIAKALLKLYAEKIPKNNRPSFFKTIDKKYKGNIDLYVDALFNRSIYGNPAQYEHFKKHPTINVLEQDVMVDFAKSVREEARNISNALKRQEIKISNAQRTYIKGILEMNGNKPSYPDANFTIRLTYGNVSPLNPADGISCRYYTTLDGVMEKEDPDNWEFVVSPRLKELYKKKDFGTYARPDGKMPVNFIANTHTTGGNSGSPVMNSKGELIGIGFDRNWEGITGDIQYQKTYQRTICTDIRYILFIIDKYAEASHLLEELNIN
ncbi:S46 family peptidase [Coprobacter sp.]